MDVTAPANGAADETLFWIDGANMLRGACASGVTANRENCQTDVATVPLATVQANAAKMAKDELDKLTAAQAAEIKQLKEADPSVTALADELSVLDGKKSQLDELLADVALALQTDADETAAKTSDNDWYAGQLAAIAKKLEGDPENRDLQRLKEQYLQEKDVIVARLAYLKDDQETLTTQQTAAKATLEQTTAQLTALQAEYKAVYDALAVRSTELDDLAAKIAVNQAATAKVDAVIAMIESADLTYRGSMLAADERDSLTLISAAFGGVKVLHDGHYVFQSGYNYGDFDLTQTYNGSQLTQLHVTWSGGSTINLACTNNSVCTYSSYQFKVIDETHVNITYSGSYTAVFAFDGETKH